MKQAEIDALSRLRERLDTPGVSGITTHWPNLVEMFFAQAEALGDAPFLWNRVNKQWAYRTYRQAAEEVAKLAAGFRKRGLKPGQRVVIVSENRPEFCLVDLAIMAAGGGSVPTYTTNTVADHLHILQDSSAVMAVVSNINLARPLYEAIRQSGTCRHLIGIEPLELEVEQGHLLLSYQELQSADASVSEVRSWATMKRSDLACLIYTSGTGGAPRGVMHHHGAILHNVAGCTDIIVHDFEDVGRDRFLSFLPLSHAYEHTAGQFLPIGIGAEIFYSEGLEHLAANIEEVRPSIMVVVPRLFELLRGRIIKAIMAQGGLAPKLLVKNDDLAERRYVSRKGRLPLHLRPLDFLLEHLLRKKVRAKLGGRLKALVSGGAPLHPEIGHFFLSMNLSLLQGYGQTEAAPVVSCNRPATKLKIGTVGPPLRDTEVRIAEDGEILVSGELVMQGYWRNEEESARVLHDGWLHTGDIGLIDEDGHIVITDRKRDIIINDKGENIAPQKVEGLLTLQPEIMQAMIYGDRKPWMVGLVVPDEEFAEEWAKAHGVEVNTLNENPEFQRVIRTVIDRVNKQLTVTEKVRRVILADEPFTIENTQLTPSLKIRRHILHAKYGARLEALYSLS